MKQKIYIFRTSNHNEVTNLKTKNSSVIAKLAITMSVEIQEIMTKKCLHCVRAAAAARVGITLLCAEVDLELHLLFMFPQYGNISI